MSFTITEDSSIVTPGDPNAPPTQWVPVETFMWSTPRRALSVSSTTTNPNASRCVRLIAFS